MDHAALKVAGMTGAMGEVHLDEEQVHQLVIAAQGGDDDARNELLESGFIRLAASIADAYWRRVKSLDYGDMFSEAVLALVELAVPRYNGRIPFQQWAQLCIRIRLHAYIRRELTYRARMVPVGLTVHLGDMAAAFAAAPGEDRESMVRAVTDVCMAAVRQGVIKPRDMVWLVAQARGFTEQEIADKHGCSHQAVDQRLARVTEILREWTAG